MIQNSMKASITLDMKKCRLRLHKTTLKIMNNPEYVCICISFDEKKIAIYPCEECARDSVRVSSNRCGEIYSLQLFDEFLKLRPDLKTYVSYRIDGMGFDTGVAEFCISDAVEVKDYPNYLKERDRYEHELRV